MKPQHDVCWWQLFYACSSWKRQWCNSWNETVQCCRFFRVAKLATTTKNKSGIDNCAVKYVAYKNVANNIKVSEILRSLAWAIESSFLCYFRGFNKSKQKSCCHKKPLASHLRSCFLYLQLAWLSPKGLQFGLQTTFCIVMSRYFRIRKSFTPKGFF